MDTGHFGNLSPQLQYPVSDFRSCSWLEHRIPSLYFFAFLLPLFQRDKDDLPYKRSDDQCC